MTFFKGQHSEKCFTSQQRLAHLWGVVLFIASAHVFYYKKIVKKPSRKKPRKNPGQKKSWARSSRKFLQKTNSKFITTTQKMGRRRRRRPIFGRSAVGAPVVVMNFVSVFCKGLQELLAQLFSWPGFLDFFFSTFFPDIFSAKKVGKTVNPTNPSWRRNRFRIFYFFLDLIF